MILLFPWNTELQYTKFTEEVKAMGETVSAVLITKNECHVIRRCLKGLKWFDETVVYDTGSTDDTPGIAERDGARVFRGEPIEPFHFAEARNRANEKAAGPWILSIDADEILREGGLSRIRKAIEEPGDITAYCVTFINRANTGTVTIPVLKIKLFRKDAWTWKYRVHEQLVPTRSWMVGDLPKVVMEHMPEPSKELRHGQNIKLLELCTRENPEYMGAFKHLGLELMLVGKHAEAIPYFSHYIDKSDDDRFQKSRMLCHVGKCLVETGKLDEALEWYERAAKVAPERRDPMYHAAIGLIKACRLDEAITWIKRMIAVPVQTRQNIPFDLPGLWGDEPARMLRFCEEQIKLARAACEARKNA